MAGKKHLMQKDISLNTGGKKFIGKQVRICLILKKLLVINR